MMGEIGSRDSSHMKKFFPNVSHKVRNPGRYVELFFKSTFKCTSYNSYFFVGSIVLGPRMDRFRDESSKYISGHSIPLISLGGFILIFGFFAFNAGSQVFFISLYDVISYYFIIYCMERN